MKIMKKQCIFKTAYNYVLFKITFLSFLLIFLIFLFFATFAPGNYNLDSTKLSLWDIVFAIVLLINDVCIVLSFFVFLQMCYFIIYNKRIKLIHLWNILMGLYPIVIVLFCCHCDFYIFIKYLISPIYILFNF